MRIRFLAASCALAAVACHIGPSVDNYALAQRPNGAAVKVEIKHGSFEGELLAASDTALVILESVSSDNLLLLRYELIQSASVEGVDHWLNGERPSHGTLVQLRRVSRFPQGISPEIARALFQAYHDSTFTVVLPP